jgi:phosphoadenylyl-sulfate reductase (thioredoxin)
MAAIQESVNLDEIRKLDAEEMLAWAHATYGDRAGIVTSFQNSGCVMIDMASRVAPGLRVLTVDTLRLHDETYNLMREIEARYGVQVERFQPDPDRVRQMMQRHGEYLFFDSKPKQEYCCQIRKVEPHRRALESLDVWITGLRRDQSNFRKETARAGFVEEDGRVLLKLSPLADWTEERVAHYIEEGQLPYNKLYDQGYTSIGCVICTTPTKPWEDKRAGRWRWFNHLEDDDKECGIHIGGSGI